MKKKIFIVTVFCIIVVLFSGHKSFAKYVLQNSLKMQIYIDKTPPEINLSCDGKTETFVTSNVSDIQKRSTDVKIDTSDNVKIQSNHYYFNQATKEFGGINGTEFESGKTFTEEGFYKIVATDTSGNKTEIVILIDKSPPNVFVEYFKKGETSALTKNNIRKVAANSGYFTSSSIVNASDQEAGETLEIENVFQESEEPPENSVIENNEKQESILENQVSTSKQSEVENTEQTQLDITQNETEKLIQTEVEVMEEIQDDGLEAVEELSAEVDENVIQTEEENAEVQTENVEAEQNTENIENFEVNVEQENQVMLMAVNDAYVGNESEFRAALASQVAVIHIRQSIDFTSPVYINYPVTIFGESTSNSLRYGNSGSFIVIQNGGLLVLDSMVVDTKTSGVSGMIAIDIQAGGQVTFINSSIIDGGAGNTGILVNNEATLLLWSSEIVNCGYGINLQMNGNLIFATQEGRANNFYWNMVGVFIDNFSRTCDFNQNIVMHDNTNGIFVANSSGTVNVSAGEYYNNYNGLNCGGSVNVSGGSFYGNTNGIVANNTYSGKLTISNANIHSNQQYSIYHEKTIDGGCTILGGSISGAIFLGQDDNYVNTNSSYPTFTVTPSNYYFKRKLVKTANNSCAENEILNVTLTPKDSWYKYVDNEYIVLWQGSNVIVKHKDYYGNILGSEIITGDLGAQYTTTAKEINGYDLVTVPENASGIFAQQDIIVEYQYDLVNCAKVTFEDLLSGEVLAQYWYNKTQENFTGDGTNFANNTVFEDYGYYKIVVQNGVGLKKEIVFLLNKDSLKR